jgi:radical SAM superfamily enzyme YgiQ (UPF0313 family)
MEKILFINPCIRPDSKSKYPPVGLSYILTAVHKAGFEFELIDMDAHNMSIEDLRKRIQHDKYSICALGCIVTSLRLFAEITSALRDYNPEATIIAGNSVACSIPELLLRNTEADVAVMGEGDYTIVELIEAIMMGRPLNMVKGIAFLNETTYVETSRRELIADLDTIGFPNWDFFELDLYNKGIKKLTVDEPEHLIVYPLNAARGCPFHCTFCYHVFQNEIYRRYSDDMIIKELKRLQIKYKATFVQFWDELTFPNISSAERFIARIEKLPIGINWEAITRGDLFRKKDIPLIRRMQAAGCKSIAFSIENANPEILKAMNKNIQIARIVEHCDALFEAGLTAFASVIFGYPQETPETVKRTIDLCERCNIFPSVGFIQPLPCTPIYDWAMEKGFIKDELEYLMQAGDRQDFHINLTKMPTKEFIDLVVSSMQELGEKMGIDSEDPIKTNGYHKPKAIQKRVA